MRDIYIEKVNESFLVIRCDDAIARELYDEFTFHVPGYKFMPLYRNGIWDGQVHLFQLRTHQIPYGLMARVASFAKRYDYSVGIQKDLRLEPITNVPVEDLNLAYVPHDYQQQALDIILADKKRLIESPTGSGKSLIIYMAIRKLIQMGKKILLVVPTVSLVEQMYKDFKEYGWNDVDEYVHKIYAGKEKKNDDHVVISTWQSIYKLKAPWFNDFDAVLIDEAHLASATSLKGIMEKAVNAEYRIGLTGTIQDAKAPLLTLVGLFGEPHQTTKSKELMERGLLSDLKIEAVCLRHPQPDRQAVSRFQYKLEVQTIVQNRQRNNFIVNLALDQPYNTLVLFNFVEGHGDVLYDIMQKKDASKHIFYIHGGTHVDEREFARQYTEEHGDVVILASYGTFSTGINIKNLNSVIFAHPYKSKIKNLQSIGRVLRKAPNGQKATLYDIGDDYSWKKKKNTTYRHFLTRLELYEDEGFNYKVRSLDL